MVEPRKPGRPRKTAAKPVAEATARAVFEGPTPEQREIAELKAQLAALQSKTEAGTIAEEDADETLTIHFLDDGLTVIGVKYKGQELTVRKGTDDYERVQRFISQSPTVEDQYRRWGRQRWAYGHYPLGADAWLERDDLDYGGPSNMEYKDVPQRKGPAPKKIRFRV